MSDIYRVGFTGMRAIKDMSDEQQNLIKEEIQTYLLALAKDANLINEDDIMQVYVGGAIGFDQLAFDAAYELKEYIDFTLELIIAIPFIGYNNNWINGYSKYKDIYDRQLSLCKDLVVVDELMDKTDISLKAKYQLRNEFIVNNCDTLIAMYSKKYLGKKKTSGTLNCIKYAKSINKEIIYVSDEYELPNSKSNEKFKLIVKYKDDYKEYNSNSDDIELNDRTLV